MKLIFTSLITMMIVLYGFSLEYSVRPRARLQCHINDQDGGESNICIRRDIKYICHKPMIDLANLKDTKDNKTKCHLPGHYCIAHKTDWAGTLYQDCEPVDGDIGLNDVNGLFNY